MLKKNPLAHCIFKTWLQQYLSSHIFLKYDLDTPLIKRGRIHVPLPETRWACDCGRSDIIWLLKIDYQRWYSFHLVPLRHLPLEPWAPCKMSKATMPWVNPDDIGRPYIGFQVTAPAEISWQQSDSTTRFVNEDASRWFLSLAIEIPQPLILFSWCHGIWSNLSPFFFFWIPDA